jgi:hypothetical protein
LDESGQIAGQWDGLGVDGATLLPGDRLLHLHRFTVPADQPVRLVVGLYDGDSLARFGEPVELGSAR